MYVETIRRMTGRKIILYKTQNSGIGAELQTNQSTGLYVRWKSVLFLLGSLFNVAKLLPITSDKKKKTLNDRSNNSNCRGVGLGSHCYMFNTDFCIKVTQMVIHV